MKSFNINAGTESVKNNNLRNQKCSGRYTPYTSDILKEHRTL